MIFIAILIIGLLAFILYFSLSTLEYAYVYLFKRPVYIHLYIRLKKLTPKEVALIRQKIPFYNKLSRREQGFFQHRVIAFMNEKEFEGREGFLVDRNTKLLISATAVMLSFGMRNFFLGILQKIIVYPDVYYSNINKTYHKGEFNPLLKVLVFSWKDFEAGFANTNDNINLGIHEFVHVLQLNSNKFRDISASIFSDTSKEIITLLKDESLRASLIESHYFRNYAYTNQYEFLAVIVEYFIESPKEFRQKFPQLYHKVKEMLNFNFAGY